MKIKSIEEISLAGDIALIYSQMGIGKTLSTLLTAPLPIAYLDPENRPLRPTIDVIKQIDPDRLDKIGFVEWEGFSEGMSWLDGYKKNLKGYSTLFLDSYTALMSMNLLPELQEQDYASKITDGLSRKQKEKVVATQLKTSLETYGILADETIRITAILKVIAKSGVVVICSALEKMENLMVEIGVERGPALEGKKFLNAMPGNFNLIGRVVRGVKEGKIVYPPIVSFRDPTGKKFLAKYTGLGDKTSGPLDWGKILGGSKDG